MSRWRSFKIVIAYVAGLHTAALGLLNLVLYAGSIAHGGWFGTAQVMAVDSAAALFTAGVAIVILTGMLDK